MKEFVNEIQKTAKAMALYEDNESTLFAAVNDIPKSDVNDLVKQYSRVVDNFRPVNLLRYELLNRLKEGDKLSSALYDDIKEKIRGKNADYFRKYGAALTESLVKYPDKKKDWFTAWKNPFRVLYVFMYRDKLKSDTEGTLQRLTQEIQSRLNLNNFSSNRVDFDGATNFGSSYCWLAFYPNTKLNHQRAYQLFLQICGDHLEAGLMPGWKIQEPEPKDVRSFDNIENALVHLEAVKSRAVELNQKLRNYWKFAPGQHAVKWDEFHREGIMAISWDRANLKDLNKYGSTEELAEALGVDDPESSNEVFNIENFRDASIGDIVIANRGKKEAIGIGVIESAYEYHPERTNFPHVRKVNWLVNQPIPVEKSFRPDTFSPTKEWGTIKNLYITKYPELENTIKQLEGGKEPPPREEPTHGGLNYWWLNANPKIWNFEETPVGQLQTYTSHNEKGNKRQKYKYFQEVKPGDIVVGYVTSPQREVTAICKITKSLHRTENGEEIQFEKIEQLAKPIHYETLQAIPDLAGSEPLVNNQGSLFKLTEQEYEIIRSLIDETNIQVKVEIESYDKKKAMKELFLAEAQFDEMLDALKEKKNVILQGPPGVGKTYVAKRLAYGLIESNDPQRIEMIQFHQSYSYEDFIHGFRPTPKGHFELKHGIFHQFCRRAQREESAGRPYVFIIDEINRGNLSKIFGELMMLIEPDKRGKEYAIPLAYSQDADEKFYIPENLYLIGMMNTADRSLAMVDYALRRRFRFVTLRPEFASETFQRFLAGAGVRSELAKKIVSRMAALNEVISADAKNPGPGYQIGHSYFCPKHGIEPDEQWYRRVVESEIVPLIQEYWFDNEQKVKDQRSALLA